MQLRIKATSTNSVFLCICENIKGIHKDMIGVRKGEIFISRALASNYLFLMDLILCKNVYSVMKSLILLNY